MFAALARMEWDYTVPGFVFTPETTIRVVVVLQVGGVGDEGERRTGGAGG